MNECPYCLTPVTIEDVRCPKCGREIARWQTGFYTRQKLPKRTGTIVLSAVAIVLLLILAGLAKSCHWI
jgi:uncharacterized membrane protein YvbJ